jgi:hypothetical protein
VEAAVTSAGAQTTADQINAEACRLAQQWASTASAVIAMAAFVDKLDVTGLQQLGFTATGDATAFKNGVDLMKTVAQIFQGAAGQASPFNFADGLSAFIGPDPAGLFPQ